VKYISDTVNNFKAVSKYKDENRRTETGKRLDPYLRSNLRQNKGRENKKDPQDPF
jgi:hypothetical protein